MIEKECKACGKFFMAKTKARLYCDDCRKNGKGKKKYNQIQNNSLKNIKNYPEEKEVEIITYNCEYCGKEHTTYKKGSYYDKSIPETSVYSWDNKRHQYCCEQHKNIDLRNHLNCFVCGKSLKGNNFDFSPDNFNYSLNVCSEECKKKFYKDKSDKRIYNRTCKFCGKTFQSKTKKDNYCSEECKKKEQEQIAFNESHIKIRNICPICNKRFEKIIPREQFMNTRKQFICSSECLEVYKNSKSKRG